MSITLYSFLLTFIAGFSTMIGTILIFFKEKTNRVVVASLSFASGVMLTVSILDLIPEAITLLNYKSIIEILIITVFMVLGALLTRKIDKCMPEVDNNSKKGLYRVGIISMFAIIMHNIPEGIATFMTTSTNLSLGLSLTIAIALHNIPEGISIAVPVYYATNKRSRGLMLSLISGLAEPLGAILAYVLLKDYINETLVSIVLMFVAGIMTTLAINEMIPEVNKYNNKRLSIIGMIIGAILVLVNLILF